MVQVVEGSKKRKRKEKEKTTLLSMVKEKLMMNLSFPFGVVTGIETVALNHTSCLEPYERFAGHVLS